MIVATHNDLVPRYYGYLNALSVVVLRLVAEKPPNEIKKSGRKINPNPGH